MLNENYVIVDPKEPLPCCLAVVMPESRVVELGEIEASGKARRFMVRAILSDHIPLAGDLSEVLARPSQKLLLVQESPLTIYLHHGGDRAIFFDVVSSPCPTVRYVQVFAESKYPSNTFLAARTAVNCLLDSLMRGWSLPLTIARMDLHLDEEEEPICHQLVLPFAQRVRLDPLGGVHQFPPLAAHESMLREAITATSPFYRFLCAYRLYEGIQPLRKWLRDVAKRLNVSVKLPKPPRIDPDALRRYGFTPDFVKGVRTTEDVWEKMNDHRDRVAHFLTKKGGAALPFHDGRAYLEYSLCGAFLLKCSHEAFRELWLYFSKHLNGLLTLGSVLPIIEQRGDFILRPDTPSDQPRFRAKKR